MAATAAGEVESGFEELAAVTMASGRTGDDEVGNPGFGRRAIEAITDFEGEEADYLIILDSDDVVGIGAREVTEVDDAEVLGMLRNNGGAAELFEQVCDVLEIGWGG